MPDWLMPILSLVGAALGAAIVLLIHLRETREQYRKLTFEQRLKAHQEAIALCYELRRVLNFADKGEKFLAIRKIEIWWESNCLSIDTHSRQLFYKMVSDAYDHVGGWADSQMQVWNTIIEARDALVTGIGQEHLPTDIDEKKKKDIEKKSK